MRANVALLQPLTVARSLSNRFQDQHRLRRVGTSIAQPNPDTLASETDNSRNLSFVNFGPQPDVSQ